MLASHHYSPQKRHTQEKKWNGNFLCTLRTATGSLWGLSIFKGQKILSTQNLLGHLGWVSEKPALPWPYSWALPEAVKKQLLLKVTWNRNPWSPNPVRFRILKLNHMLLCNSSTPTHPNCAEMFSFLGNDPSHFATSKSITGCLYPESRTWIPGTWDMTNGTEHVPLPCLPQQHSFSLSCKKINIFSFHLSQ